MALTLSDMRNIVHANMPYDTGFMFMAGAKFAENAHFLHTRYDVERVPYIHYQEVGFTHWITGKFIDKNQGFISEKTVGDLMRHAYHDDKGMKLPFSRINDKVKRRASTDLIKQGALDKIRGEFQ